MGSVPSWGYCQVLALAEASHAAACQNGSRIQSSDVLPFKLPLETKASDVPSGAIAPQCSPALYLVGLCTKTNSRKVRGNLLVGNVGQPRRVCG